MATQLSSQINGLEVTYRLRTALKPHPQNPNSHTAKQVERIARSIREFGWTNPIIIDEEEKVLAGHGRLLAAAKLGIDMVPTICLAHFSAAQRRAYIILDNRLSEIGGTWDKNLLALEHEANPHEILGIRVSLDLFADEVGFNPCNKLSKLWSNTIHLCGVIRERSNLDLNDHVEGAGDFHGHLDKVAVADTFFEVTKALSIGPMVEGYAHNDVKVSHGNPLEDRRHYTLGMNINQSAMDG